MARSGSSIFHAFKAATCLLMILAISITCASASRTLTEDVPLVGPVTAPATITPTTTTTTTLAPTATVVPATTTTATLAPTATVVPTTTVPSPIAPTVLAPTAEVTPAGPATTGATMAHEDGHQSLTFFMHDILGGSNPSARIVTGIVSNPAMNGQLPFARPNGPVLPGNGGVNIPNGNNNGVINNNNIPFLTGLGGQTTSTVVNNNGNNVIGGNGLPFFNAGQLPAGSTLQKLLFGTMTVIDDVLTEGHEMGSGVVGKAQGFYVSSSEDGTSQTMAFTAMFESGHYADSLCFFGVHKTAMDESQLAVMGGTGKYVNAKGYATAKTLHPVNQDTDGAETLLELTVYLA